MVPVWVRVLVQLHSTGFGSRKVSPWDPALKGSRMRYDGHKLGDMPFHNSSEEKNAKNLFESQI